MSEPQEYIDVLDCTGAKAGTTMLRAEAHQQGVWHGAVHCLIINQRHGHCSALFQLRSRQKLIAPGSFDVTVGGHYGAGEDARAAGPRELREELGLQIDFKEFLPLGRRVFVYCHDGGLREYEFQDVFLLEREIDPAECTLQTGEVDGLLKLEIDQGIALFSGRVPTADGLFFAPGTPGASRTVAARDFVACIDEYYLKLLLLARQYFAGERELLRI